MKQKKFNRIFVIGLLIIAGLGGVGVIVAIFQLIKYYYISSPG